MAQKLQTKNLQGIWFWLKWITIAIAGFTASIAFWNWLLLKRLGADVTEPRVTICWFIAVFGSWFLILTVLMKKKEKVMGHMDKQDEATVSWWLIWIGLTIGTFFLSVWFWTPFIAEHFGSIKESPNSIIWVIAVFGTWLIALTPLMIFMYQKVDYAYERARAMRQQKADLPRLDDPVKIRSILVDEKKRRIPEVLTEQLKKVPPTIKGGHLVTAILKDGRRIENVFIAKRKEILGLYDAQELLFDPQDIVSMIPANLDHPPDFTEKVWLRLDGNSA
ncbi:MAG: hypothetical protein COV74_02395 [Candidatus Omnitrophica bacterium CG11_big_fil_rev_8_21_14_0_20_45_26]|uniref:Uncharacterized protein n=1 Tax=Candidatus Abzuiibacterium crystallinum TaxID=1974748 RepID=A0A2H0LTL4_9BACT|nr:MAG: hypothetical protein COV74_02395 [Candidatus Omnitrophica bacterium CG11_big_fil_rev_8_21_14_0_20_45_26]PIW64587.1 MAG: hypothetical protein COW12_05725 [Candidatus Omnitrophica bacterium CG12_big_fil_rev_8_21_14_0_65_45_16]